MAKYRCYTGKCKGDEGRPWIGEEEDLVVIGSTVDLGREVDVLRAPCGHEGPLRRFRRLQDDYELKRYRVKLTRTVEADGTVEVVAPTLAIAQDDAVELAEDLDQWIEARRSHLVIGYSEVKGE